MFNWDFETKNKLTTRQKIRDNSTNNQDQNEIDIFIRETVQNSVDATLKCDKHTLTHEENKCDNCPPTLIKF